MRAMVAESRRDGERRAVNSIERGGEGGQSEWSLFCKTQQRSARREATSDARADPRGRRERNTDCPKRCGSQQPTSASSNSLRGIEVMLNANKANNIVASFSINSRDER